MVLAASAVADVVAADQAGAVDVVLGAAAADLSKLTRIRFETRGLCASAALFLLECAHVKPRDRGDSATSVSR